MESNPGRREEKLKKKVKAGKLPHNSILSKTWFRGLKPLGPERVTVTLVCEHYVTINPMVLAKTMTTLAPTHTFAGYDIQQSTYVMWQDGMTPAAGVGMSQRYWASDMAATFVVTAGPSLGSGSGGGWVGMRRDLFGGMYPESAQTIWEQCSHQYLMCQPKSVCITYTPLAGAPKIKRMVPQLHYADYNGTTAPAANTRTIYQTQMETDTHKPAGKMIAIRDQMREITNTYQPIILPPPATNNWNQLERTAMTANSFVDLVDFENYINITQQRQGEWAVAGEEPLVVAWPELQELVLKTVAPEQTDFSNAPSDHIFDEPDRWGNIFTEPGFQVIPPRQLNVAFELPGASGYGMVAPGTTFLENNEQAVAPDDMLMYRMYGAGDSEVHCDWWYKRFGITTFMLEIPPYQAADRADTGVTITEPTFNSSDQVAAYKYRITKEFTMEFTQQVDYPNVDALEEAVIWPPLVAPQLGA